MKQSINISIILLALISITAASCKRTCDIGYEGKHCVTEVREKYIGRFAGSWSCPNSGSSDSVFIATNAADVTRVTFRNIQGKSVNVTGIVQTDGTINIASQNFAGNTIAGNMTMEAGKIKITYTVTDSVANNCMWIQN